MGIIDKIKKEAKRVEKRISKEADRVEERVISYYSPDVAIEGILNMDTGKLLARLRGVAKNASNEAVEVLTDWLEEEIRISKSKLDDYLLPLVPSIKEKLYRTVEGVFDDRSGNS